MGNRKKIQTLSKTIIIKIALRKKTPALLELLKQWMRVQ